MGGTTEVVFSFPEDEMRAGVVKLEELIQGNCLFVLSGQEGIYFAECGRFQYFWALLSRDRRSRA
jgi:hypothetical protein